MFKALSKRMGGSNMIINSGSKAFLIVEESLAAPKSFIKKPVHPRVPSTIPSSVDIAVL